MDQLCCVFWCTRIVENSDLDQFDFSKCTAIRNQRSCIAAARAVRTFYDLYVMDRFYLQSVWVLFFFHLNYIYHEVTIGPSRMFTSYLPIDNVS